MHAQEGRQGLVYAPADIERWLREWTDLRSLAASGVPIRERDGGRPGLGLTYADVKRDLEWAAGQLDADSLGRLVVRERMRWPRPLTSVATSLRKNKSAVIAAHREAAILMAEALGRAGAARTAR